MKKITNIILFILIALYSVSQDMNYAYDIVKELSSQKYYGRGYVNKGDSLASVFLEKEFEKLKLKKYNSSYFQEYTININRIIEKPVFIIGEEEMELARDFVVIPSSPDVEGKYKIEWIDKAILMNSRALRHFLSLDHSDSFICIDSTGLNNPELYKFANIIFSKNYIGAKGIIEASPMLKYTARTYLDDYVYLQLKPEKIKNNSDSVYIKIKNDFVENYETKNLIGYIRGESDSIILIGGHYDHMGMCGDVIFPGANDNASGVAMVLNLAQHYSKQKKNKYTMVFALFSGEEAGLLGSEFMAGNPPFDIKMVKAMLNFDMVGTGEDGVYMFNAKEYPQYDSLINEMNKEKEYFDVMHTTKASYSSDHASFYDKGVEAVFIYTEGEGSKNYHQPEDIFEGMSFAAYRDIYRFVITFINKL
ncbi:MAG: DUF4910 domain-containing protein [Bacteroidales bacterium]|jgi:hypothetical protein|nr:DUF4910 domain-containing protein [Bacteroidales bacterium]